MFNKITEAQVAQVYVQSASDRLSGPTQENKKVFDKLPLLIVSAFNGLIDGLSVGGAESIGAEWGDDGLDLQSVLDAIADALSARYTKAEANAAIRTATNGSVVSVTLDETTGIFTITHKDGTSESFDTALEKVPASFSFVEDGGAYYLKVTNLDGSSSQVDVTALMNEYAFSSGATVVFEKSVSGTTTTMTAEVRKNSLTEEHLSLTLISTLEGYVASAAGSASASASSASSASASAASAESALASAMESAGKAGVSAGAAAASASEAASSANNASGSAASAEGAASAAGLSKDAAAASAKESESWAVGGTGTRTGEDTNNAKYWAEQSKSAASGEYVPIAGGTMTGELILSGSPASANGAATKEYVDQHGGVVISATNSSYTLSDMEKFANTQSALYITDSNWNGYFAVIDRSYNYDDGNAVFTFIVLDSGYVIRVYKYTIDESGSGEWSYDSVSLALKNSPVFTGIPQAPVLTQYAPDTQIAVRGYVDPAILVWDEKYTKAELDKIVAWNKRIFIKVTSTVMHPVVRTDKSDRIFTFHCYMSQGYWGIFEYNSQTKTWTVSNVDLAPIDSPTFTGTPKAPTATKGTNTTQIATTEFVQNAVGNPDIYWVTYNQTFTQDEYNELASLALAGNNIPIGIIDQTEETRVLGSSSVYVNTDNISTILSLNVVTARAWYSCNIIGSNERASWNKTSLPNTIYDNNSNAIRIWTGTQTEYDAITTKNANTLYLVKE